MRADLLFEIGTEEIPAGFLARALAELPGLAKARLEAARLEFAEIVALGTPRRLTLAVRGLADRQAERKQTIKGPPVSVAFKLGQPTAAATGFAKKIGLDLKDLQQTIIDEVAYLTGNVELTARPAREILPALLVELARAIPWKKSMRWANLDETFVRPVHWIVALYGGEVVPLQAYGVASGGETRGHRFLAPGAIALDGTLDDYRARLRRAFVIVEPEARRTAIEAELLATGLRVRPDADLLAEVANLVEYPKAVAGTFDEAFLTLPREVIISSMRGHQRYFATEGAAERAGGGLDNKFVTIAGTLTQDMDVVRHGNERVLAARLADARFFYEEDRETDRAVLYGRLQGLVFQKDLGTVAQKVQRIIAFKDVFPVDAVAFERAALACKLDLVSKMVGEFPDLQGVMGRYYAAVWGETPEVAEAILEHYLPRGASDRLPQGALGAALGVADRVDTIAGCWSVGLAPTGSADAYGLRRAALAVLNLLIDRGWSIGLDRLLQVTQHPVAHGEVLDFLRTRLRGLLVDGRGLAADCVEAALAAGFLDVPDAVRRAVAVAHLRDRPDFEPLGIAFKRVANILKGETVDGAPDPARFTPAEAALWDRFAGVRGSVEALVRAHDYDAALRELATLKPHIDRFFDDVLVMDPDLELRQNRLRLLGTIAGSFIQIADFRQLAVK